jgi:hypothetical protein
MGAVQTEERLRMHELLQDRKWKQVRRVPEQVQLVRHIV